MVQYSSELLRGFLDLLEAASECLRIIIFRLDYVYIAGAVPQSNVFGPLLFLIFVNDLPDMVSSAMSMFATDKKT